MDRTGIGSVAVFGAGNANHNLSPRERMKRCQEPSKGPSTSPLLAPHLAVTALARLSCPSEPPSPQSLHRSFGSNHAKLPFLELVSKSNGFDSTCAGVSVSPDSLCVLSSSAGGANEIMLFEFPRIESKPVLSCGEGDYLYDYCWWPLMDSRAPSSCCFAATSRGKPVHLWDAYSGHLRATYNPINQLDEVANTVSLAFSSDGARLFAGVESGVYGFDVQRPGTQALFLATRPTRKSRTGQRGIISTLACCPTKNALVAAGSYAGTVGLYAVDQPSCGRGLLQSQLVRQNTCDNYKHNASAGVSQVKFSPCGTFLFAGARMGNDVVQWDTRMMGRERPPLKRFPREARTNQRIHFDLDGNGSYLATGSSCGRVLVYDLSCQDNSETPEPCFVTEPHPTAVNGVSFRPALDDGRICLAIATGERDKRTVYNEDSCSEDNQALAASTTQVENTEDDNILALYHLPRK